MTFSKRAKKGRTEEGNSCGLGGGGNEDYAKLGVGSHLTLVPLLAKPFRLYCLYRTSLN